MIKSGRLMRALNDPKMSVHLIAEDNNYKKFQVVGSCGNIYDVMISRNSCTCTCLDFLHNSGLRCKHQLLCIINNVTTELNSSTLELGSLQIEDLDKYNCAICHESISGAFYRCKICNNLFDASCIYKWSSTCSKRAQRQSCPTCRSDLT